MSLRRSFCARVALFLMTLSTGISGCATTHNKSTAAEAKRHKPQQIRPLTESYALSDETVVVDNSILQRGAKARGADLGY